jgi:hypothetical protein
MVASTVAGPSHQERTMSDKVKDIPEKKLDKQSADQVKGGSKTINPPDGGR